MAEIVKQLILYTLLSTNYAYCILKGILFDSNIYPKEHNLVTHKKPKQTDIKYNNNNDVISNKSFNFAIFNY